MATRTRPYTLGKRTPPDDVTRSEWSRRLRAARHRRGMSQSELAASLGYTRGAVSAWECGVAAPPLAARLAIADALHTDVTRLFPARPRKRSAA